MNEACQHFLHILVKELASGNNLHSGVVLDAFERHQNAGFGKEGAISAESHAHHPVFFSRELHYILAILMQDKEHTDDCSYDHALE